MAIVYDLPSYGPATKSNKKKLNQQKILNYFMINRFANRHAITSQKETYSIINSSNISMLVIYYNLTNIYY